MSPAISLWKREMVRFVRQRSRIVGAFGSPLIFWLLIGSGMGRSFMAPDGTSMSYLEYFFPGTLVMIVLFTAIFSTISIIEDRREGFLQGVLVAPVSRLQIVLGKILGGSTLAVVQALLLCAAAPWIGLSPSLMGWVAVSGVLVLLALGLTALGYFIAWRMETTQGFHAIMNVVLLPMWLLSGALFPPSGAAGWIQAVMLVNPLTFGHYLLSHAMLPPGAAVLADAPPLAVCLGIWVLFTVVMLAACVRLTVRKGEA